MTALDAAPDQSPEETLPPQLADLRSRCEEAAGRSLPTATELHAWSVASYRDFWRVFLDWADLVWEGSADLVSTSDDVQTARFFPDVRLNYTENVLRRRPGVDDDAPALTSVHADGSAERLSREELRTATRRASRALARAGVAAGDTVLAIAANHARTAVAALAVSGLGAALSTATPDMGVSTLLGRFGQLDATTALIDRTALGGGGAAADQLLTELLAQLPTVRHVVLLDDLPLPRLPGPQVSRLTDLLADVPADDPGPTWPRQPFDAPLWVLFSSGTTGPPKAMVHGAGGSLLEHEKEHRLHLDLRPSDTLYFHTTTAWMMWNWQLSALSVGAHVVLYDGPVTGPETLWTLAARHGITVFGTSPAYLQLCQDEGWSPRDAVDLSHLRAVLSTGAVLHPWQFEWITEHVGPVPVVSLSGGTDIVGCFVLGHPEVPVQRGRCQSLSLGLDVGALGEDGHLVTGEVGELVCSNPFPSRPVRFLQDPDGERFRAAYFAQHPGRWTHGDRIEIAPDGSSRLYGRSDGVLNINGVRIGPSEIYSIVREVAGVADAIAVETRDPEAPGSSRLALLVVLRPGVVFDDDLARQLRSTLRREGSAAHVPSLVLPVDEIPLTHSGKRSESAARAVLDGEPVRNVSALKNPGSLAGIAAAAAHHAEAAATATATGDDVRSVVARVFGEVLGAPVPDHADFFDAGGTSRQTMTLLRRLRLELHRPLLLEDFLAQPSIAGITRSMTADPAQASLLEVLRPGERGVAPLLLVHGYLGDVDIYRAMVDALRTPAPVHGLTSDPQIAMRKGVTITEIASSLVAKVQRALPEGDVRLAGYSFGGLVAYEMARQLAAEGRSVTFLGLLDTEPPFEQLSRFSKGLRTLAWWVALLVPGMVEDSVAGVLRRRLGRTEPPSEERQTFAAAHRVFNAYAWGPYAGPVTYFRARFRVPVIANLLYAWRRQAPDLTVVDVPGSHHVLLSSERSPALAAALDSALAAAAR
ncbi:acetoacetate--CoA ligase [Modestobacter sp. VKM Ac-2983]|uniref:acetoacetate--CoA ligase n=1 Tax=Modestobacter sp. VKM Ac-2983 TaxID=3004137 RepID=UPI0022AB918C|nr:acetoacetate--CoA ligase [Modestobacter sp. VKM Ac-2983]MCZ2803711.1 acetoacetate--CoA ligase [Modestobacter sp. VKM Ac-2983]